MTLRFRNRTEAGRLLAARLEDYSNRPEALVLALPRGGVPVGYEIAQALHLPLDICLVRKLGTPRQPELAMGAIAPGQILVLNNDVLRQLQISRSELLEVAAQEKQELDRRMQLYRSHCSPLDLHNRLVMLVDDGIATSSTLRAAIASVQQQAPQGIIVAAPVGAGSTCEVLSKLVQQVICLSTPEPLHSIGLWYEDFSQTSDAEVCDLLERACRPVPQGPFRSPIL
jgi:putative phosphoribosyl transferase